MTVQGGRTKCPRYDYKNYDSYEHFLEDCPENYDGLHLKALCWFNFPGGSATLAYKDRPVVPLDTRGFQWNAEGLCVPETVYSFAPYPEFMTRPRIDWGIIEDSVDYPKSKPLAPQFVFEDLLQNSTYVRQQVAVMRECGMAAAANKSKNSKKVQLRGGVSKKKKKNLNPVCLRGADLTVIHKGPGVPNRMSTWLDYHDQTTTRNNVGVLGASWRYGTTLFSPDQVVAGPIAYRTFYTGAYNKYRILGWQATIGITNNEAFNIVAGVYPSNNLTDPGLNTATNWQTGPEQPGNLTRTIGAIGGMNQHVFSFPYVSLAKAYGPQVKTDPNWEGTGGTPTNQIFYVPWFKAPFGVVLVSGVTTDVRIAFRVMFYDRVQQFTALLPNDDIVADKTADVPNFDINLVKLSEDMRKMKSHLLQLQKCGVESF